MITRNFAQRLKRLEARAMLAGVPVVMEIVFVCPVEGVVSTLLVEFPERAYDQR
jgi:hypothetical protein